MRQPKVTNTPVTSQDEGPQPVAQAVNPPARVIPNDDRPDRATGDPDSIANWANRKGAPRKDTD